MYFKKTTKEIYSLKRINTELKIALTAEEEINNKGFYFFHEGQNPTIDIDEKIESGGFVEKKGQWYKDFIVVKKTVEEIEEVRKQLKISKMAEIRGERDRVLAILDWKLLSILTTETKPKAKDCEADKVILRNLPKSINFSNDLKKINSYEAVELTKIKLKYDIT